MKKFAAIVLATFALVCFALLPACALRDQTFTWWYTLYIAEI